MIKPKKSVEEMNGYFVPLYERQWDIKIDSNENNYGASPKVLKALSEFDLRNVSFYPFYGELSQKIADFNGFNIDNIKVTNGADEALQSIIQTYLEKGEKLLTLDCSFEMPVIYAQIQGGEVVKVPFEKKWQFPVGSFLKAINDNNLKIIYIASPNNPTGSIIEEEDLIKILETAKDKVIIIDETYANYADITYKKYVNTYDNVFIVKSFSKDFALAGLRLGYIISNAENINNLKKVVSPFSVNVYAMAAGIAALDDLEYFDEIRGEVDKSKQILKDFFESIGGIVYSSYANFLLVDFGEKAGFIHNCLKKNNISVKLFKQGSILENHLRVTIPTPKGIEKIIASLSVKPALVFDMDGVLIDARNSYRAAIEKTFEQITGKTVTQKEIQDAKNLGGLNNDWDLTKYLLEKYGYNVSYQTIIDIFQEIYWKDGKGLINNEEILFDRRVFEELSKNYNLCIFTGRLRAEAMFALNKFKVADLFYPVITTDDIPEGMCKPDPYGLDLVKNLTTASKYYYFGDTKDDILSAVGAKYIPVGVLPPQDKSEELSDNLKQTGAKFVIKSVNDITTILEQKDETVC